MLTQTDNLAQIFHLNHKYNFVFFLDVLKEILSHKSVNPFSIEIRPTYNCNLECDFCYNKSIRKNTGFFFIQEESWYQTLKEIDRNKSIKNIILNGGGEPLMYPQKYLLDLFDIAKNKDILISIVTNGTLLRKQYIDVLSDVNCLVNISIKSLNQEGFMSITGKDLFVRQMDNIREFLLTHEHNNNRIVVARYVFAEPISSKFDFEGFSSFLMDLFSNGLDAFLITFSNPFSVIHNMKSTSYSSIYDKITKNNGLSLLLDKGRIRFSNLRYLSGNQADIHSSTNTKNSSEGNNFRCYIKKLFSIISPYGTSDCPYLLDNKHSNNQQTDMINVCRSCTYYNANDNIIRVLQNIQSTDIEEKKENIEYILEHGLEYFGGCMSNEELSEMNKYIKYITNSSNKVIQGLPYILH